MNNPTSNLVTRLRAFPGGVGAEALCRDAADEIERLRAALQEILDFDRRDVRANLAQKALSGTWSPSETPSTSKNQSVLERLRAPRTTMGCDVSPEEAADEIERMREALESLTKGHTESPQYPGGHIYSATCPACNVQSVAKQALSGNSSAPETRADELQQRIYFALRVAKQGQLGALDEIMSILAPEQYSSQETETYHGIGCAKRRGGECNCAASEKPEETTELRCAICTKTWDDHKTIITHDFKHKPVQKSPARRDPRDDKALLDWLESECADLTCVEEHGHDDIDVSWRVTLPVRLHPDEPADAYGKSPRQVIDYAMREQESFEKASVNPHCPRDGIPCASDGRGGCLACDGCYVRDCPCMCHVLDESQSNGKGDGT